MLRKPLRDKHLLRNTCLVKFNPGARQLGVGLDEIAGVGPKPGVIERDHQVGSLAGKTGKPSYLLVSLGRILAPVRVGACKYNRIPVVGAHQRAQGGYSFCEKVHISGRKVGM